MYKDDEKQLSYSSASPNSISTLSHGEQKLLLDTLVLTGVIGEDAGIVELGFFISQQV
jgi:hypothetical protein